MLMIYGGFISTVLHGKIQFPGKVGSLFAGLLFTTQVQSSCVDLTIRVVTIIFYQSQIVNSNGELFSVGI